MRFVQTLWSRRHINVVYYPSRRNNTSPQDICDTALRKELIIELSRDKEFHI